MTLVEDSAKSSSNSSWQRSLKQAFRNSTDFAQFLDLPEPTMLAASDAAKPTTTSLGKLKPAANANSSEFGNSFPLFVSREFANRIRRGDWNDPLLRQVWVDTSENLVTPGFLKDPVGDSNVELVSGLLHKYHGRMLMVTTGACAIHCRYCFRRHYPYSSAPKSIDEWEPALHAIAADGSIQEVILSGGDPLSIVDSVLSQLVERLERIPHLKRLRIHTRFPIVIPSRITSRLIDILTGTRLSKWIVLHINHANEVDDEVLQAIELLRDSKANLLNQSVLLRGVNDDVDTLVKLSERLLEANVIPYYLHQLDPVQSAAHFEVPVAKGTQLLIEMAKRLPGFAVPKYVFEKSGEPNKTLIY